MTSSPTNSDARLRWLVAALSLLTPGLGHVYAGVARRGILLASAMLLVLPLLAFVFSRAPLGLMQGALPVLAALGLYAWMMRDAVRQLQGTLPNPSRRRPRVITLVTYVLVCLACFTVVREWTRANVVEAFRIPGGSMEPTILAGDWLYAAPLRRSAVVRCLPVIYQTGGQQLLHRIVGLPGDTVLVVGGRMQRNGRPVDEAFALVGERPDSEAEVLGRVGGQSPLIVPSGHVFLLGDNRSASMDSRVFGPVPLDSVRKRPIRLYFSRDPSTGTIRWTRAGRAIELAPCEPA